MFCVFLVDDEVVEFGDDFLGCYGRYRVFIFVIVCILLFFEGVWVCLGWFGVVFMCFILGFWLCGLCWCRYRFCLWLWVIVVLFFWYLMLCVGLGCGWWFGCRFFLSWWLLYCVWVLVCCYCWWWLVWCCGWLWLVWFWVGVIFGWCVSCVWVWLWCVLSVFGVFLVWF